VFIVLIQIHFMAFGVRSVDMLRRVEWQFGTDIYKNLSGLSSRVKNSKSIKDRTNRLSRNVGEKITFLRYVKSQKNADLIYNSADVGSEVFYGTFIHDNLDCPEKPLIFQHQSLKVTEPRLV
jgi:hypothetical protein